MSEDREWKVLPESLRAAVGRLVLSARELEVAMRPAGGERLDVTTAHQALRRERLALAKAINEAISVAEGGQCSNAG